MCFKLLLLSVSLHLRACHASAGDKLIVPPPARGTGAGIKTWLPFASLAGGRGTLHRNFYWLRGL